MAAQPAFLLEFRDLLGAAGIRAAVTSGMACVHYRLQQSTKDIDWIVEPAHLDALVAMLSRLESRFPPWRVAYRPVFGAPLHRDWMQHGWTSHIEVQPEPRLVPHHLDFFGRPPRVRTWSSNQDGFAERDVVAAMKRTDRDRDWPFVDGLGWQIADEVGAVVSALHFTQDGDRLRWLWAQATPEERQAAAARRPLLAKLDNEPDPDRLEGFVRLERLVWQQINRFRYGSYQEAWKVFYRSWRADADWSWPTAERFEAQHQRLLAAAAHHRLPKDPLVGVTNRDLRERAIAKTAAISLVAADTIRAVAPPPDEVLT